MKKILCVLLLLAMTVTLISCNVINVSDNTSKTEEAKTDRNAIKIEGLSTDQQTLLQDLASEWDSIGVSSESDFRLRQYDFALKLYRAFTITSENKNVMLSPLSIQLALAMAANGAKGETKSEMEQFLGGVSIDQLNNDLNSFVKKLPSSNNYKLGIANSIWGRNGAVDIKESFINTNKSFYNAELYSEPFDNSTVEKINNWVSENTDKMIDRIIDDISPDDVLHLINAIIFDAKWASTIDEFSIREGEFTAIDGKKKTVEMMHTEEYEYIITDDAVGFVKPYKDKKYSFVGILPNEDVPINDYIESLDAAKLCDILDNIQSGLSAISFPKFEYEYEIDMTPLLCAMGMSTAFTSGADFTDMATSSLGNIYISSVRHKTYISVDNEGTRAAAVTDITCKATAAPTYKLTATFDRPFVYMIIENETKLPIFIGTVMDIGE